MANYNRIILVGNLTRDPLLKYLPSGASVTEFGLAVNHRYKTKDGDERDEVMFVDCSCFGKAGEVINQYCAKGKQLMVEGRLKLDTWEDKQGGGRRSKHSVMVENFQLMGGKQDGQRGDDGEQAAPAKPPTRQPAKVTVPAEEEPPAEFTDDDIPF